MPDENPSYPIAVGGAGLGEPIEAFSLELFERVEQEKPATITELRTLVQSAIEEVHKSDIKISAWPRMYHTTKCIVAAKPTNDDFAIFAVHLFVPYGVRSAVYSHSLVVSGTL